MSQTILDDAAEQGTETVRDGSSTAKDVAGAVHDGLGSAKRAAKRTGAAVADLLEHGTQRLQHNLVLTIAVTFALGFTAGTAVALTLKRR